ncbi:inositol monophosphatase family protein [Streptoalloteichus tenebrarius]|nr:inositol monophosphatase family protein [Streptoalloteichus tenebrarius]
MGFLVGVAQSAIQIGYKLVRESSSMEVYSKGDRDLVTEIDLEVERRVRGFLLESTPEIGFLGEEGGQSGAGTVENGFWVLDPLDGTANLVHGVPLVGISLALIQGGEALVSAIALPFLDLQYGAAKGLGSFVNGKRLNVSTTDSLPHAMVSIGDYAVGQDAAEKNRARLNLTARLAEQVERVRMFGSAAIDLAWLAHGRIDATVILSNKTWDTAAGVLIAREAGAVVVDRHGNPHNVGSTETIAANPALVDRILELVRVSTGSPN